MSSRKPCDYCEVCSREPCVKKNSSPVTPTPVTPIPTPVTPVQPTPQPVKPIPTPLPVNPTTTTSVASWFTQDLWDRIFPYSDCSAVYDPINKKPFWTRDDFVASIDWMNKLPDSRFHGFGSSSTDVNVNKLEIAAFMSGFAQECGDPSLLAPYPWLSPPADVQTGPEVGSAGGCLSVIEGLSPMVVVHKKGTAPPWTGPLMITLTEFRPLVKKVLGLRDDDVMSCIIQSYTAANQPQFGLGAGTGSGAVLDPGLTAVSDDGTLYGDKPRSKTDIVQPLSTLKSSTTDRRYACLGTYCQTSGHGAQMLSYTFNFSDCSIDLFGDYRLIRYPNLIITTDRDTWCGLPQVFGFPGPIEGGKNKLPSDIATSTPPARILAFATSIWFWMVPRSGRSISCHDAMMQPTKYGITAVNLIVNNQSGLESGTWAAKKLEYYKRICAIMGLNVGNTIVSPPGIK
jgi:hypothetical protein